MRTFEHFPENTLCRVCGKSDDKECVLIPIDGPADGCTCQALPIHVECLQADKFRFNPDVSIFYLVV